MAYCTQSDVEDKAGGAARLVELADWDQDGTADADRITSKIAEVSAWIDSYAGKKRAVAFSDPAPDIVRWTCAAEVVYRLLMDRRMATEADRLDHEDRLTWLQDLARGRVTLGQDPEPSATSVSSGQGDRESDDTDSPNVRADYVGFV